MFFKINSIRDFEFPLALNTLLKLALLSLSLVSMPIVKILEDLENIVLLFETILSRTFIALGLVIIT